MNAAREITEGKLLAIFQPHGFAPLRFMREELLQMLKSTLQKEDIFALLPVYYAGGTASFTPKSEEVVQEYQESIPEQILYFASRPDAEAWIRENCSSGDTVVIMGARDNSLSDWAFSIVR
jgi:UDP-N-acetylmuramate--alanine ligase